MSPEEQSKVIELIEAVVAADGVIDDKERDFLRRVTERFRRTWDGHTDRIAPTDAGRTTTTLRGLPPDAQARVMALLVEAAVADGIVEPEEHALLLASAAALGIEADALEERIARRLKSNLPGI